jgi:hypothetical protein
MTGDRIRATELAAGSTLGIESTGHGRRERGMRGRGMKVENMHHRL